MLRYLLYCSGMEKLDPAKLREVPSAEIEQELGLETIYLIQDFQTQIADQKNLDPIGRITRNNLFPPEALQRHGPEKLIGLLACNTSIYNDEIEDAIDADPLTQAIIHMKLTDPNNIDRYTIALRVRRTVVAILHDNIGIDLVHDDYLPNHSPSSAA
jgi:hypothetical protein